MGVNIISAQFTVSPGGDSTRNGHDSSVPIQVIVWGNALGFLAQFSVIRSHIFFFLLLLPFECKYNEALFVSAHLVIIPEIV